MPRRANPPGYLITVGGRIAAARKKKGLSREQFAELIGVSPTSVAQYERGETEPSMIATIKILTVLDLLFQELTEGLVLPEK